MPLAQCFYNIDQRGILVNQGRLAAFKEHLKDEIQKSCQKIETSFSCKVVNKGQKGVKTPPGTLNLSSPPQLKEFLTKTLGIKLPKTKTKRASGYSFEESTGEEALNEAYAKTGHTALKEILRVRELNKIEGTYADATLLDSVLYSSYSVAVTKTGRRSSRSTPFTDSRGKKIGTNGQNLPKQSTLGKDFRYCLVARPGKVFLSCDQVQAEDWVVSGIITDVGGGTKGLDELRLGVDRHKRLAMAIFQKPESECGKGTMFRFMGKKTRHAGNYDMRAPMMASSLAKEGFSLSVKYCDTLLERFHNNEPEIRGSFHHYVETQLRTKRILRTPIGREMYFFGLRPDSDNSKLFKEGYAWIPQSTVGDNTGLAVLHCERHAEGLVVMDGHDSITLEVDATEGEIIKGAELLRDAFARDLVFPNGSVVRIPIEYSLGFDLKNETEFKCLEELKIGLRNILNTSPQPPSHQSPIISGVPLQQ
jgi:DNA polymerase I-like protein with 3'-5' exonuclease and polymerase domains